MTDEKNNPQTQSSMNSFPEPKQFREQAEKLAKNTPLSDLGTMTHAEIQQQFHELQVKQIETELQNEQLRIRLKERDGQAELFRIINENMLDIVALTDMEGNLIFAGKSHEILGYEPGFLIGKNVMDFVHPEDLPHVSGAYSKLVASGNPHRTEYRCRGKDGSYLWLETRAAVVKRKNTNAQEIVFSSRDISARKQAEEAFRESENKFYLLTEEAPVSIMHFDKNGIVKFVNKWHIDVFAKGMLGRDFFINKKITDLPGIQSAGIGPELEKILEGETVMLDQVYIPKFAVGHEGYQCIRGAPLFYNGEISGGILIREDITERKQAEMALRESEERYRNLYENTPAMMHSINCHGEIVDVSNAWLEKIGYSRAEVLGCQSVDFLTEESHKMAVEENLPQFYATGSAKNAPYQVVCKNGRIMDVLLSAISEKDSEGRFLRSIAVIEDITERKQVEMALRESEQRFKTIIQNLPGAVFAHDLEGRLLFVNKTASANTGYSEQELLAMTIPDIDSGHFTKDERHQLWHSLNIGESKTIQSTHTRKNGSKYPVEIHLNAISLDNQPVILPIAIDITERKKAEKEIAEQNSLIKAIYSNAPLIMMVVDRNRRLRQVSGFATQFAGSPAEEMIGLRGGEAMRCLHALDDPRGCGFGEFCRGCVIRNKVIETLEHGVANLQFEAFFDFSSEDKTQTLALLVSTTPIPFQGENMALVTIMDITERKQAENEKEKLQAQLSQAQKLESVGRLAGGVAHDFNNMLSIINGYAEISIEMLEPEAPVYRNLQEIYNAGKRSEAIVRQLLAFARKQTTCPVQLDLNDKISGMIKMLQRLIGENINLAWHPGKNLWPVKIDPSQMDQIMANLAVNARDAIEDIGKLTIETKNVVIDEYHCRLYSYFVPGRYVMLAVSDNGCGMEKEVQDNLFEPFFTTKGVGKGTGLGLSTIYGIVKQNKGFINVYSEPGQGTTFKIYLPPNEEQESGSSGHLKESAKQMPTGSETILLVEDESAILHMGRGMLEELGYTVLTAERPDDALRIAEEYGGKNHLLITDVVMPEMNGRDLAAKVSISNPAIKTLYMSGYTADVIAHHGVIDEGVHYIQKPFSMQDLAVKVREAIEQE